jgi:hypothetical protein
LARIDPRQLNTPRISGQPTNLGGVISSTSNGSGLSSITVKRMKGGVIFLSPDLVNQLKSQGATAVITSETDATVTISFFHIVNKIDTLLSGVGNTLGLTPKTVNLTNVTTFGGNYQEQRISNRLSGTWHHIRSSSLGSVRVVVFTTIMLLTLQHQWTALVRDVVMLTKCILKDLYGTLVVLNPMSQAEIKLYEINKLLCKSCQAKLRKLYIEKVADAALKEPKVWLSQILFG